MDSAVDTDGLDPLPVLKEFALLIARFMLSVCCLCESEKYVTEEDLRPPFLAVASGKGEKCFWKLCLKLLRHEWSQRVTVMVLLRL